MYIKVCVFHDIEYKDYGLLRCGTYVSEEPAACIFRLASYTLKMEAIGSSEALGCIYETVR